MSSMERFSQEFLENLYFYIYPITWSKPSRTGIQHQQKHTQENLQEKSLIGHRLIYNEVKASGKQPHNFEISNGLVLNCKTAHARYTVDLAKNKENQAPSIPKPACEKRKLINERILDAKRQKMSLKAVSKKWEKMWISTLLT